MRAAGYSLEYHASLDSTNKTALELARRNWSLHGYKFPIRHWVIAEKQRAGRGRQGRSWFSPLGNFYGTLLYQYDLKEELLPFFGFVAGVSVAEAISFLKADLSIHVALKWPNDLLLNGKKAGGILVETIKDVLSHSTALVLGIGVNISSNYAGAPYLTTSLHDMDIFCSVSQFFQIF